MLESGLYAVTKFDGKEWNDCGILSAEDTRGVIGTYTLDEEMTEVLGDMVFSRKNTTHMVIVTKVE